MEFSQKFKIRLPSIGGHWTDIGISSIELTRRMGCRYHFEDREMHLVRGDIGGP